MSQLILPRRFYSQPQDIVGTYKRGFIWLPHMGDVGYARLIQEAGTQITSASLGGVSAYNAGSTTNRIEFSSPYADGDMTIVAVCSFTSVGSGRSITGVYKIAGNAVANYLSLETSGRISAVSSDNNNWAVALGRIAEINALYSIVGTFKSGGKRTIFVNGVKDAENTTARTPVAMEKLIVGTYLASGSYGSAMTGHINLSVVLPVYLSDEEATELSANPWQLFRAKPRVLYFDVGGGATAIDSDLSDSYVLRAAVSSDLADSYAIRAAIAADLADSYAVLSSVAADLADSYAITASVNADLADSYLIRASVAQDLADSYALRASIASDLADSYTLENAGTVSSDLADSYLIRAAIASDLSDSAAIRTAVLAEIADEYIVRSSVSQDLADQYTVIGSVQADLDDSYIIRAAVTQDLIDSYTVFSGSGTGATVEEIVAAIFAAAQINPIWADIRKVNDIVVDGSGTEIDPWGPV